MFLWSSEWFFYEAESDKGNAERSSLGNVYWFLRVWSCFCVFYVRSTSTAAAAAEAAAAVAAAAAATAAVVIKLKRMSAMQGPTLADDIQSGLCAPLRIHRELALLKLTAQLEDVESGSKAVAFLDAIFRIVLKLLAALEWQSRLGGLESAQASPWICFKTPLYIHFLPQFEEAHLSSHLPAAASC
jgi:hypothetical protein